MRAKPISREPTDEMLCAALIARGYGPEVRERIKHSENLRRILVSDYIQVWRAMWDAAPEENA